MEGKLLVAHIDKNTLSFGGKRKSLEAVNLIKEDRCEKMKGKNCANDSKHKKVY